MDVKRSEWAAEVAKLRAAMAYCASARPLVVLLWQLVARRWFGAQAAGRAAGRVVAQELRLVVAAAGVRLGGVTNSRAALADLLQVVRIGLRPSTS